MSSLCDQLQATPGRARALERKLGGGGMLRVFVGAAVGDADRAMRTDPRFQALVKRVGAR